MVSTDLIGKAVEWVVSVPTGVVCPNSQIAEHLPERREGVVRAVAYQPYVKDWHEEGGVPPGLILFIRSPERVCHEVDFSDIDWVGGEPWSSDQGEDAKS